MQLQYKNAMHEYSKNKQKYDVQLSEFKEQCKEKKESSLSQNTELYLQEFSELLKQAKNPQNISTQQYCQKGISEIYFLEYLKRYYGDKILINTCLTENGYNKAYPDFIYWDKSLNIIIDIEIDEPYRRFR